MSPVASWVPGGDKMLTLPGLPFCVPLHFSFCFSSLSFKKRHKNKAQIPCYFFHVNMSGMSGILGFTEKVITVNCNATILIAIGQNVGLEFIAKALKYSRFVHLPTSAQTRVRGGCTLFGHLFDLCACSGDL